PQAVVDQAVDQLLVAEFHAVAQTEQIIWRVRHRFHAAGEHDLGITRADRLRSEHHGLESGAAHAAHRHGTDVLRHTAADGCLARGRLARSARQDLTDDDVVDLGRIY